MGHCILCPFRMATDIRTRRLLLPLFSPPPPKINIKVFRKLKKKKTVILIFFYYFSENNKEVLLTWQHSIWFVLQYTETAFSWSLFTVSLPLFFSSFFNYFSKKICICVFIFFFKIVIYNHKDCIN